jgi:hypothetical protein
LPATIELFIVGPVVEALRIPPVIDVALLPLIVTFDSVTGVLE